MGRTKGARQTRRTAAKGTGRQSWRQRLRLGVAVTVPVLVLLLLAGPVGAAVIPQTGAAGATTIAQAIAGPGTALNLANTDFVTTTGGAPNGISTSPLAGFGATGSNFGILTTGNVNMVDDVGTRARTDNGGGFVTGRGNTAQDITVLRVGLTVPQGANCLTFDFKFLSEEHPDYATSGYNDAFIAELDTSTWTTTSGSVISAPNNFAFGSNGSIVSVKALGLGGFTAANGDGTTYSGGSDTDGGATGLLRASTQITPGPHAVFFSIFDQGDRIYDSAVFLDNLVVGFVPDPAANCKPGVTVTNFGLTLTPSTGSAPVGGSHTVTATLTDRTTGAPVANQPIGFTVVGTNPGTDAATTNASGQATFTYTGDNVGTDQIAACYQPPSASACLAQASATQEWTNRAPTADAGGPYSAPEGGTVALSGSGSDDPGDTLTYDWDLDGNGTFETAGQNATFSAAGLDGPGSATVGLRVCDNHGACATSTATVTVNNVAPAATITGPAAGSVFPVGSAVTFKGAYSDPGTADTHKAYWTFDSTTSSTPPGVAVSGGTVTTTHTFATPGVYSVKLTVTDDDGGIGAATTVGGEDAFVVIYDPTGGFVTGGGWINSPTGAYAADPTMTGKASFGFVSKYQKGATVPTGETEFQFKAGNLNFKSTSYDWLVIAGARAQYKGSGTINGKGNYGFMLTAVDGQVNGGGGADKFRIKIWDKATGAVIYDNQVGAGDDAAPTTTLGGGSIVIHNK